MNRYQFEAKLQSNQFNPVIFPAVQLDQKNVQLDTSSRREVQFPPQSTVKSEKELQTA